MKSNCTACGAVSLLGPHWPCWCMGSNGSSQDRHSTLSLRDNTLPQVVLATNIAETSVTIPGIRYVVDPGLVKARVFDPRLGADSLLLIPVSKAQARQRRSAARHNGGACLAPALRQGQDRGVCFNSSLVPVFPNASGRQNSTTFTWKASIPWRSIGLGWGRGNLWDDYSPFPWLCPFHA